MPFSPTFSWKCVKKRGKSWLSFPPFTKHAPRLSLQRTIFAQGCRWDTTFTLFYAFSRKCGWKRTFTSRNRPKTEPKTLIRQCNKMLFKVRVLMLNFMNLATFHEFAEKRCQFCPNMWLHNIWLFELLKYLTQHRLCINTHTLNNVYQMSF